MKRIITYNVNGIRAAMSKGLIDWIKNVNPDIVYWDDLEVTYDTITSTGVKSYSSTPSVSVYPNPSSGMVMVSIGKNVKSSSSIEVFDLTGKLVSRINNLNGRENVNIDLTSLPSGMYFGVLKSEGNPYTFKMLKK